MQVPLEWKLSVQGSNEVKAKLQEINSQFERGEISAGDYAKGLREVNRDARTLTGTTTMQRNIFLSTHPAFNQLSRATSTLASVSRTALTIINAMNLARIASLGASSQQLQIEADIARVMRDLNKETDPAKIASLNEELGILNARLKELKDGNFFEGISNGIILISTAALGLRSGIDLITKLAPALSALSSISFGGVALSGIASILGAFVAIPAFALAAGFAISEFFKSIIPGLAKWHEDTKLILDNFFLIQIPQALGQAGLFLTNFFLKDLPTWAGTAFTILQEAFTVGWNSIIKITEGAVNGLMAGLESLINGFISVINRMISAYNSVASKLGLPKLSTLGNISLPRVTLPIIAAANGFDGVVNKPTMFLAGEAGSEQVSITPHGQSSSNGNGTIIINVQGSVITERELVNRVDSALKDRLKRRGFT